MNTIKRITAGILSAGIIALTAVPSFALTLDPTYLVTSGDKKTNIASLETAFENAKSGDIIEQDKNLREYTVSAPISVKTDVTLKTEKNFYGTDNVVINQCTSSLFTVENGGKLTLSDCTLKGNTSDGIKKGGLVYVKNGGTLVLDGATLRSAFLNSGDSFGGVIYAEKGGKVIINSAKFKNNYSANGLDLYAEDKEDITVADGVLVDFAAPEGKIANRFNSEVAVLLNGKEIEFDVQPQIIGERTMVPMRKIFEALGATVDWNGENKSITSVKDSITIKMTIGDGVMYKNAEAITLDVPPMIVGDRTLVPVRAIAESFGVTVGWIGETGTVVLTSGN